MGLWEVDEIRHLNPSGLWIEEESKKFTNSLPYTTLE